MPFALIFALLIPIISFGEPVKGKRSAAATNKSQEDSARKKIAPFKPDFSALTESSSVENDSALSLLLPDYLSKGTYSRSGKVMFSNVGSSNASAADECPAGFKTMGGNAVSDPSASIFKNKLFVFVRGADNALYYRVSDGKQTEWQSLGGDLISNPATFFNATTLYVEVTGADNQRYHRATADGVTFGDWVKGTIKALTTTPTTSFKGVQYTFKKGNGVNPPVCYQRKRAARSPNQNSGGQNSQRSADPGSKNSGGGMTILSEECPWDVPDCNACPWYDPYCNEPPPPQGDQYSPNGVFDGIDTNNNYLWGWSFDPDSPSLSNDVHVYIDGPAGSGAGYGVTANQSRPDVNQAFGISGDHGFSFQIPAQYADGQQHVVYVYGIDTGANAPVLLSQSSQYFTRNPPPPATPSWGTINAVSQTQLNVYWNVVNGATAYNVKMDGNVIASNFQWASIPVTNLAPGSTHTFEVQAISQWGVSGWSSPLSGTTQPPQLPATPTWGTVNTISQTQLDVYWNGAANATGYNLRRNGNQIATNIPHLSYPATGLAPGTTYTFEVQGVNQWGVSAWSSPRSGTTQAPPPPPTPTPTPTPPPPPTPTPTPGTSTLSRARLSPKNETGGTNLYSRNFGWGTALAGLPGRGLDAGLGISYNSLVWVKDGNNIVFNPNKDNVTPGFRFGFPVVEPAYADSFTQHNTYLMVTPSGSRVEFRQVGTTDTYETADSSYAQIKVIDANNLVVTATDGTQSFYTLKAGMFRCALVKDSNGNFITVNHDNNGLLQSVTDTLGRVFNVSYDAGGQPSQITQARAAGTFVYATFTYTTQNISTNFSGVSPVGVANGANVKVLQKIAFADASEVRFEYTSYGQVWRVSNYAPDGHKLNHTATNLDWVIGQGAQMDCPRFTQIRNWAEDFNPNQNGEAWEVYYNFEFLENQTFTLPDNTQATGTVIKLGAPDGGKVTWSYVSNSGWREGMTLLTEDWAANEKKRWTWTKYTQDETGKSYIVNPRVVESRVGDSANVRKTTVSYRLQSPNSTVALYGLVEDVTVYDTNGTSQLKRSHTDYNLDPAYVSRRIIGLPAQTALYDANDTLMSRVTYGYDEGNMNGANQNVSPVQHDNTNYGAGFVVGRGNLTSTARWDATDPNNTSKMSYNVVKYNTAGSSVAKIDPLNRTISIGYNDSFDDNQNRNTFAYPTTITDPDNHSSTVKYRFDIGANVYATSPAPLNNPAGKTTSRIYDALGRLERETIVNTGAYTRYEYPATGIHSRMFSTVTDVNGNGADAADEVLTESVTDGAGRVRRSRTLHPGSGGGWSATQTEYDQMGRVKRQSVPTEVDSNWQPAGDDAARGWLWTTNEYDWKGRPTRIVNTDGTDKLFSYEGCGCAGGQVTTAQGEALPEGRRKQKIYEDILGRIYKSETLNWDGSIYSATKTIFNGRDQATSIRQYEGADTSPNYQETTMTYDGHGRLQTQHVPQQNANTATVYNYNADDTVQSVIDARSASTNYTYNSRRLVTQISYAVPNGSNIPVAPTVNFSYDNAGNRSEMTDGLGTVAYEYNQSSQLTAETRQFSDSLPDAPMANNRFKIQYNYNLSGKLAVVTDPYGAAVNYGYDKAGRLGAVTGTPFDGVTTYAQNPHYRAWGALQNLTYGNGDQMNLTFNNRLQAASYALSLPNSVTVQKNYQYYPDGNFKYLQDANDARFDRLNIYDHAGRISEAKSGAEARGETPAAPLADTLPYRQSYVYNAFGNLTQRNNLHWGKTSFQGPGFNLSYNYSNNRVINNFWSYDEDGRSTATNVPDTQGTAAYDAAGRLTKMVQQPVRYIPQENGITWIHQSAFETERYYDGDGQELKRKEKSCTPTQPGQNCQQAEDPMKYFVRSTVFAGEVLTEVNSTGRKLKTFVKANGVTLAWQAVEYTSDSPTETIRFEHLDVSGMSRMMTTKTGAGAPFSEESDADAPMQLDPMGGSVGLNNPYPDESAAPITGACTTCDSSGTPLLTNDDSPRARDGSRMKFSFDDIAIPWSMAKSILESGGGMMRRNEALARQIIGYRTDTYELKRVKTAPTLRNGSSTPSSHPDESWNYGSLTVTSPVYNDNWAINLPVEDNAENQQRFRKLDKEEVDDLRTQLSSALSVQNLKNGKTCNDFLTAVLRRLGADRSHGNNIMNVFNRYATASADLNKKGFTDGLIVAGRTWTAATSTNPHIQFDYVTSANNIARGVDLYNRPVGSDTLVITLIHELIHGAGKRKFEHPAMADAMYEIGREFGIFDELDSNKSDFDKIEDSLKAACGGSKGWDYEKYEKWLKPSNKRKP